MEPNLDARVEGDRAYELRADISRKWTNAVVRTRAAREPCFALWVSVWRRARRRSTFGIAWKVAGSAKCARCAFDSPPM